MIQDIGYVCDGDGLLGDSEQEIVVLHSVDPLPQATDRGEQLLSDTGEVVHVIDAQQQPRRPRGLEECLLVCPVLEDLVFIAIDQVCLTRTRRQPFQSRGSEDVIVVEKHEVLALGCSSTLICGYCYADVLLQANQADSLV